MVAHVAMTYSEKLFKRAYEIDFGEEGIVISSDMFGSLPSSFVRNDFAFIALNILPLLRG